MPLGIAWGRHSSVWWKMYCEAYCLVLLRTELCVDIGHGGRVDVCCPELLGCLWYGLVEKVDAS